MKHDDAVLADHPDAPGALFAEAELLRSIGAIEAAGIECGVIKGIPLARLLYGQVDARGVPIDADLLVRKSDVQGALDALIGAGYNSPYISRHQADLKQLMRGIWKVVLHRRCESGVIATIELHWAPFSPRTFPLDEYLVWRHMGQVSFHGPMIRVPDPELTVLLLACHVAQSGLAQEQMLADLAAAWDRFHDELDSETLFGLIQGARARAAFGYAMAVAGRRGMIGSAVPSSNAPQTQWALKSWPMGRIRKTSTNADSDYQGQLAALTLCHPTRVLPEIARIGFPSRGAIAVAGNIAMPGRITYLVESYRRLIRIGKSLAG